MKRRELLIAGVSAPIALLAGVALPWSVSARERPRPFTPETVPAMARTLAEQAFVPDPRRPPAWLEGIGYDAYRDIRFDPAQALWRDTGLPFQAQFFHQGFLFREPVDMYEVDGGVATAVGYRPEMFDFGPAVADAGTRAAGAGFAGVRLHAPLNRPDYFDEVCAFLGASYFRAVAKGQVYGLSARGLALRTADPRGEEFPRFKTFWMERPAPGADSIVVHALMDGPSAAGAFRFVIRPGEETLIDVTARVFPRVDLDAAGIAPLTSMFQFDAADRAGIDDYRDAVHDSDGLAIHDASGDVSWRALHNPASLQHSTFDGGTPRGFGLMQRKRGFSDYGDAEARYDRRPSLWVEPLDDWGQGRVHLVEIPTADEYQDNIVAFWRPLRPLRAGREHRFDYRLHWTDRHRWNPALARVVRTRIGAAPDGARRVAVDLEGGTALAAAPEPVAQVVADTGHVANVVAHPMPGEGRWRISFEMQPGDADVVEMRARLATADGRPLSENWLYRWTR